MNDLINEKLETVTMKAIATIVRSESMSVMEQVLRLSEQVKELQKEVRELKNA